MPELIFLCRIAQKQCCISTVKENSCLAGMIAAKEGDVCGPEEGDPCGGSAYKVSCSDASTGFGVNMKCPHVLHLAEISSYIIVEHRRL